MRHAQNATLRAPGTAVQGLTWALATAALLTLAATPAYSDETRLSPFVPKIVGQEDFAYVWTAGIDGVGDGKDKLVTVAVNPATPALGKVIHILSMDGRREAQHTQLSDDRRYLWASAQRGAKLYVFDVYSDPARPVLHRIIENFGSVSNTLGGPLKMLSLPGRMLINSLAKSPDAPAQTALVEYTNAGEYVATHYSAPSASAASSGAETGKLPSGFGFDAAALLQRKLLVTTSLGSINPEGPSADAAAFRAPGASHRTFADSVVLWDMPSRTSQATLEIAGAPIAIRCAKADTNNYCFAVTAATARIWLIFENSERAWQAKPVATVGDGSGHVLAADLSISADDQLLWVSDWNAGTSYTFDVSDPHAPQPLLVTRIGDQLAQVAQSWNGQRLYFTSGVHSDWDKKTGARGDVQFFKAYAWDGAALSTMFAIDFAKEGLGRPLQIQLGAYALFPAMPPNAEVNIHQ